MAWTEVKARRDWTARGHERLFDAIYEMRGKCGFLIERIRGRGPYHGPDIRILRRDLEYAERQMKIFNHEIDSINKEYGHDGENT